VGGHASLLSVNQELDHKPLADILKRFYATLQSELTSLPSVAGKETDQRHFVNRLLAALRPSFLWGLYSGERPPGGPSDNIVSLVHKPTTAILGFAFGTTRDGRPGLSNEDMAEVINTRLGVRDWSRVYVQWEIADALRDRYGITQIPPECIAWPPKFAATEIKSPDQIARKLADSNDPIFSHIYQNVPEQLQRSITRYSMSPSLPFPELSSELQEGFNTLLDSPTFHQAIPRTIDLPQLERDLAREVREFPPQTDTLGPGQAIRVNRFILEGIFPDDELGRGRYLSSKDVLGRVMETMRRNGITDVILVATPGHMFRCYELTEEAALEKQLPITIHVSDCTKVRYDGDSAQSWTQSPLAFWEYDIISRARELALKQILDEKRHRP